LGLSVNSVLTVLGLVGAGSLFFDSGAGLALLIGVSLSVLCWVGVGIGLFGAGLALLIGASLPVFGLIGAGTAFFGVGLVLLIGVFLTVLGLIGAGLFCLVPGWCLVPSWCCFLVLPCQVYSRVGVLV
jgi:hypothetical protein